MKILYTLIIFCLWQSCAQARNSKSMSFSCASWEHLTEELYYLKNPGAKSPKFEPMQITQMTRSPSYKAKVSASLQFYRKSGSDNFQKACEVRLPANANRYLLIFFPQKNGKYGIKAIPDERKHSPFGSYSFYNMTKIHVNGSLAKRKFQVKPGKSTLVRLSLNHGTSMPFSTYATIGNKRQWLQRNTFHFNPKKHSKFFINRVKTTNGRIKVQARAIIEFQQDSLAVTST